MFPNFPVFVFSNTLKRNAGLDGWGIFYECRQREYPRLPLGGHLQAKEKGEDPKPPGERQWKLNLVRWFVMERGTGNYERQDPVEKRQFCGPMPHWGQQGLMMMNTLKKVAGCVYSPHNLHLSDHMENDTQRIAD